MLVCLKNLGDSYVWIQFARCLYWQFRDCNVFEIIRFTSRLGWLYGLLLLQGCGGNIEEKIADILPEKDTAYKSSKGAPPLEIPPDLSRSTINDTLVVPETGSMTFSEYSDPNSGANRVALQSAGVLPKLSNATIERHGDKRWLVVQATPAQVWPLLHDYWLEQGFVIALEDPAIGILETDWAEKREKFKAGFIENLFGKFSTALYGVATRDKFRTRLERGIEPGTTEIYISHRGVEEVFEKAVRLSDEDSRVWQSRLPDPELEVEMLNKMLVYFGFEESQAQQIVARTQSRPSRAEVIREGNIVAALALKDTFSRAWRRTGLALDRVGFTVEDRDRSRGLYFVRYIDPEREANAKQKDGVLDKLKFWSSDDDGPSDADEYLISLVATADITQVLVLNKRGERERSDTAARILSLLHEQLK